MKYDKLYLLLEKYQVLLCKGTEGISKVGLGEKVKATYQRWTCSGLHTA